MIGSPHIPLLPRLPGLPDPLRRVHVPRDLESVTTIGREKPAAAGMSEDAVERIWDAALGLYQSGVHPAVQVCVRREGAVILDRAIGHARGNGPHDSPATPKQPSSCELIGCSGGRAYGVRAQLARTGVDWAEAVRELREVPIGMAAEMDVLDERVRQLEAEGRKA